MQEHTLSHEHRLLMNSEALSLALFPLPSLKRALPNSPQYNVSVAFPLTQVQQLWPFSPEELPSPRTLPTPTPPKFPWTQG